MSSRALGETSGGRGRPYYTFRRESITRPLVVLLCILGCWHKRPERNRWETAALVIAGAVYGVDFLPDRPPQLTVGYPAPTCVDQFAKLPGYGKPGFETVKGNCTWGAQAQWTPHINVAWGQGSTYSNSGFCQATYQAWESWKFGMPDIYYVSPRWTSGEAARQIALCQARLRAAGL